MMSSRDVVVATYSIKDANKARAHRDRMIAERKEAFLTREMGEFRYGGVVNVHVKLARNVKVGESV